MPLVEMKSTKRNFALQSSVATAIKILILEAYKLDLDIVHVIHDELLDRSKSKLLKLAKAFATKFRKQSIVIIMGSH